jgi:autotransporter passenger strand-loop-strand repeat protein
VGEQLAGGTEAIFSGGMAVSTYVLFVGSEIVSEIVSTGGTAIATNMNGGIVYIASGGVASNTLGRGTLVISSGGLAIGDQESGFVIVSAGGTDSGGLISGGSQTVFGLASGPQSPAVIRSSRAAVRRAAPRSIPVRTSSMAGSRSSAWRSRPL